MKIKQLFLLGFALCTLCVCAACADGGAETGKPSAVVERFAKAFAGCDLNEAQKDAYGDLNKTLTDGAVKYSDEKAKDAWRKQIGGRFEKIKVVSEQVEGDHAVVTVSNGTAQTQIFLLLVNGDWKVTGMR